MAIGDKCLPIVVKLDGLAGSDRQAIGTHKGNIKDFILVDNFICSAEAALKFHCCNKPQAWCATAGFQAVFVL